MNKNVCSVALWLALSLLARSETYYVATNGVDTRTGTNYWTNAVLTIGQAVALASASDVVLVSNGTYLLTAPINVNKAITVRGFNGYSNTIVDGNYPTYSNSCFYLPTSGAVLEGLTISNGCNTNYGGGGVYMTGAGTLLTNCLFTGNRVRQSGGSQPTGAGAYANGVCSVYNCRFIGNFMENPVGVRGGGGIALANGAKVFDCEVISNRCDNRGGGIVGGVGTIISNCVVMFNIATNSGQGGGGIILPSGGQVVDCTIAMNIANNSGGGISFAGSSTMQNCNVYGNMAGYGGGIVAYNATYTLIDRCSISNNVTTSTDGGGIYLYLNGLVRDCLIISNTVKSGRQAGGIYADRIGNGSGAIQSCTIAGNQGQYGGGIMLANTNNFVVNTIIWSNTGASYPDVYNTTAEQSNSYTYCSTPTALPDASNTTNNPQFLNAAGFNYRLDGNSPCINTGSNQDWMTGALDFDRYSRIDKFSRRVDMGCYEYIPKGTMFRFH